MTAAPSVPSGQVPFFAGGMITAPHYFVGRRDDLKTIFSKMTAAQPTSINVVGARRIGKSSLLQRICQTYDQEVLAYGRQASEFVVVYISLESASVRQEPDFYDTIAQELLSRPVVSGNQALVGPLQPPLDRVSFSRAMDAWKRAGVLPVLCLDSFRELIESPQVFTDAFYDNLRSLMDRSALMLVIASIERLNLYSSRKKLTSNFFNLGYVLPLRGLSDGDAQDLVRLPQTTSINVDAALGDDQQALALEWGSMPSEKNHPYLLQEACLCLWDAQKRHKDSQWAHQQFREQVQLGVPGALNPRTTAQWVGWGLTPIRKIGELAKGMGATLDDMGNLLLGTVILIILGALALRVVQWEQVKDWLQQLMGG